MEFTWPVMLSAVLLVPILAIGYWWLLRGQRRAAERFADAPLFAQLVVRPPRWQRTLPVVCYLVAVLLLAVAVARPVAALPLPVNRAAVVVAVDTSRSMVGTDVAPSRFEAARAAARAFAAAVPRTTRIGLVAFSEYGTVLLVPSTDRTALADALDRLQLQSATSVGAGILEAVRILPGREALLRERLHRLLRPGTPLPPANPLDPVPNPEELPPASLIIFSDGVDNVGPNPYEAAQVARDGRVRIYTVGVGTPGGVVMQVDGQTVLVPFEPSRLQRIAQMTDGRYFASASDEELRRIYQQLGRAIGWERTRTEVAFLLVGMAGLFLLTGGTLSMVWFRRVP